MNYNNILKFFRILIYMIDYTDTVKYDTMKVIQYNINDIN